MKILVIRTDNIGDLVCTTPLLNALRVRYPEAWIGMLANGYSAPALQDHPAINALYKYSKIKHLEPGQSAWQAYLERLRTVLALRAKGLDLVLIPAVGGQSSALRFARYLGARRVIVNQDGEGRHEVEKTFAIERFLPDRLPGPPGACTIKANEAALAALSDQQGLPLHQSQGVLRVGLHISARKPSQRWPATSFIRFAEQLAERRPVEFLLFWSPGSAEDPKHPGDDEKAAEILAQIDPRVRVFPVPTLTLTALVAGLSLCDIVVQSDGGAMHLAAALGKPIVCFFGQSDLQRWHPWGVAYRALQPENRDVSTVTVDAAMAAFEAVLP